MKMFEGMTCPACKVDIENHLGLIKTCEQLQLVTKWYHGCLDEIRDLRTKVLTLETKIKEYQDNM